MAKAGSAKLIAFEKSEEENTTSAGNVERRWVYRKRLRQEYNGGTVYETKQFVTPAGYRLVQIASRVETRGGNKGVHEEEYEKTDPYTTTTTT